MSPLHQSTLEIVMLPLVLHSLALIMFGLACFVWHARRTSPINSSFSVFILSIAVWITSIAFVHSAAVVEPWVRLSFVGASFIPCTFLAFVRVYPTLIVSPSARSAVYMAVLACVFTLLSLFTDLIVYEAMSTPTGLTRKTGIAYPLFGTYFVGIWTYALYLLIRKWRQASGLSRLQLQHVVVGISIFGIAGIISNLIHPMMTGRSTYIWLGPCFASAFVAFVGHAIVRHSLMEVRIVVSRGLTLVIAMLISLVPLGAVFVLFWPKILGHLEPDELVLVLTAIALASLVVSLTREHATVLLDRYVYRARANYPKTVRDASKRLTQVLDLASLGSFILGLVQSSTNAQGSAIYLLTDHDFTLSVHKRHGLGARFDVPASVADHLLGNLIRSGDEGPVLVQALAGRRASGTQDLSSLNVLTSLNWALILPLLSEDVVIGAIVVGPKLSGDPFYPQDLDLLMTLANQAGIAVKNAQLYGQVVLANEHLENIVATIDSGVVAVNASGRVTMFNRAAELLTGMAPEQVRGAHVSVLPPCLSTTLLDTLHARSKQTFPEIELPDGQISRPVICTTSPLRDPAGPPLGAVAVFSDLTSLKELERQRRRAERLAYFEVLAAAIAHEIKNPLVAIKAFAQLVPRRRDNQAFVENFGRVVTREIERMERLVERLRTLSRPANRPHHSLDLRTALTEAVELFQPSFEEKRITVSTAIGDRPAVIQGNDSELGELFLNLLMNAQEATPVDGHLTIGLAVTSTHATVTLADSGPGIPDELLEKIFEPFVTTKQQGSGLGLAICLGIAEAHDARLRVANRPAGGAEFSVEFPLTVPAPVAAST